MFGIRLLERVKKPKVKNFGAGEYRVILRENTVSLLIHDSWIISQKQCKDKDIYGELFDLIVKKLGGRIDAKSR